MGETTSKIIEYECLSCSEFRQSLEVFCKILRIATAHLDRLKAARSGGLDSERLVFASRFPVLR